MNADPVPRPNPGPVRNSRPSPPRLAIVAACASIIGLVAVICGDARASQPAANDQVLQTVDGSYLHGHLLSIDIDSGLQWSHPDAIEPIRFSPGHIDSIRFPNPTPVEMHSSATCRLRFQNGDEMYGNLQSVEGDQVTVETWSGAPFVTPRAAVRAITFLPPKYRIVYEGPTRLEDWNQGKITGAWQFKDGTMKAERQGVLGKDLGLTGSSTVEMDLSWSGPFSLVIALYTDVIDRFDYSNSSYKFYLGPEYLNLRRVRTGAGPANMIRATLPDSVSNERMHLEIRVDKQQSQLSVWVNNELVHAWTDPEGFVSDGSGVVFYSQRNGTSIAIKNLRIAQWEGTFHAQPAATPPAENDWVYLVNQDRSPGDMSRVAEGVLHFGAYGTDLAIPLERVTQLYLKSSDATPKPEDPWQIRAMLAGGGAISFQLKQWAEDQLTGASANLGTITLDPRSIRKLQFNPAQRNDPGFDPDQAPLVDVWDFPE